MAKAKKSQAKADDPNNDFPVAEQDAPSEEELLERDKFVETDTEARDKEAVEAERAPEMPQGSSVSETAETAPNQVAPGADEKITKKTKFFMTHLYGMSFTENVEKEGQPTEVKLLARFFPYAQEDANGDVVRRGYLATSDADVIRRCQENGDIVELEKSDYDRFLKKAQPLGYPVA